MSQVHKAQKIKHFTFFQNKRAVIQPPEINVPSELPRLAKATTRRILHTGLIQNPFIVNIAVGRFSKSDTVGFLTQACTKPEIHPAAIRGLRLVKGAAKNDASIVRG